AFSIPAASARVTAGTPIGEVRWEARPARRTRSVVGESSGRSAGVPPLATGSLRTRSQPTGGRSRYPAVPLPNRDSIRRGSAAPIHRRRFGQLRLDPCWDLRAKTLITIDA